MLWAAFTLKSKEITLVMKSPLFLLPRHLIRPLVGPTQAMMDIHISTYQWHKFFPQEISSVLQPRVATSPLRLILLEVERFRATIVDYFECDNPRKSMRICTAVSSPFCNLETMRRLFAANFLISGLQRLGAEIGSTSTNETKYAVLLSPKLLTW